MISKSIIMILMLIGTGSRAQSLTAEEILNKSIQYHDPKGQWNSFNHSMDFVSERPNGPDRKSTVHIDNNKGLFRLTEEGNNMEVVMEDCATMPAGKTCEQVKRTRNYYLYLWGLPMKLKDKGTKLDSKVNEEKFEGKDCYVLRVPYEEDVWFFYIDKSTYEMTAYMFYKDEKLKKGELIYLDEEVQIDKLRIPKKRKWVTTPDNTVLGTDILTSFN